MSTSDPDRRQRIWEIESRYSRNIDNMRSEADKWEDNRTFYSDIRRHNERMDAARNKQYTRRQYMGINAG